MFGNGRAKTQMHEISLFAMCNVWPNYIWIYPTRANKKNSLFNFEQWVMRLVRNRILHLNNVMCRVGMYWCTLICDPSPSEAMCHIHSLHLSISLSLSCPNIRSTLVDVRVAELASPSCATHMATMAIMSIPSIILISVLCTNVCERALAYNIC